MEQSINLFLDNNNLTSQNSLTHLLDFDSDFNDLTNSIKPSMYYTEGDFIKKLDNKSWGHSMSDHPMLETVPPQILIKSYTFGLCD